MQTPIHAEEAVLGGILLCNDNYHDAARLLTAEHFTSMTRKRVWGALRDRILCGELADTITIAESLPNDADEVFALVEACVTARTVDTYIRIVHNNWRLREAARIGASLIASSREGGDGVNEAIGALLRLNATVTEHEFTGQQAMRMAFEQASAAYENGGKLPGITTGLNKLDAILGGFHDSDLTIIGGRPAMGKTALLLGLAEAAAQSGVPVGLISAEQPAIQIGIRRVSLSSGVAAARIRSGQFEEEDWGKLVSGMTKSKDAPVWIYDRSAVTLDELISVARKWKHTHGIRALFVDYAQRITVPGTDRITEVATVARGLKNLARDLNIPVIALAQVVKGVDTREDKRPNAGDLANSDELTREADQILMLYRDEVYNADTQNKGTVEVLIEKNRHGPIGFEHFAFLPETMKFADLTPEPEF